MSAPGCRFRPLALCFQQVPRVAAAGYSRSNREQSISRVNRRIFSRFPPQEPSATLQHPSRGDVSPLLPMPKAARFFGTLAPG